MVEFTDWLSLGHVQGWGQHLGIKVEGLWGPKEAHPRAEGVGISRHTSGEALS